MTERWALAVHETATDHAVLWAGTLFPDLPIPENWRLCWKHTEDKTGRWRTAQFSKDDWRRPFRELDKRFYRDIKLTGLLPGRSYEAKLEIPNGNDGWTELAFAKFDTLPTALPFAGEAPFNIAAASCYYREYDGSAASIAYKTLYDNGKRLKPHITFLTGDQVHLDVNLDHVSSVMGDVRASIAQEYALNWLGLKGILSNGGTWMLPDSHEYWDNFPRLRGHNPHLWRLTDRELRQAWMDTAKDGVRRVQRTRPVRIFSIGEDISFCVADLRTGRVPGLRLTSEEHLQTITEWARSLHCPGVFVCQQPFFTEKGSGDAQTLANFPEDYEKLLRAFSSTGHDILVICGNAHVGRFSFARMSGGGVVYEAVCSPLSNPSCLDGKLLASQEDNPPPGSFPAINIEGFPPQPIRTPRSVSSEYNFFDIRYPKKRTSEHFTTFSFTKQMDGSVMAECNAWRIRSAVDPQNGLPQKDFEPGMFVLR